MCIAYQGGTKTISQADRIKIDGWDYIPSDELLDAGILRRIQ